MALAIKELREQQQALVVTARSYLDEITDVTPEARAKELETSYDKVMADFDKIGERVDQLVRLKDATDAMAESDTIIPPGDVTGGKPPGTALTPEVLAANNVAAYRAFVQYGLQDMSTEHRTLVAAMRASSQEVRAQSTAITAGGYTIPEGFLPEITKTMLAWGPMLNPGVTRVLETATGNDLPWPGMDDTAQEGALLAENVVVPEQDIAFTQKSLGAYKYTSKLIKVSLELLQDTAFNFESEIISPAFGERLGRIGNKHLTIGTGVDQPNGIVTASSTGHTATGTDSLNFDDFINLYHSIDPAYRMAAMKTLWMFNDSTLKTLRKLKDGDNNYIWQAADARSGAPSMILDHQYSINQAMASIAAGEKPVLFGDFNKYIVRRVRNYELVRLNERYMDHLQVGFFAFMRIDGELTDSAAIKHMKMAAA